MTAKYDNLPDMCQKCTGQAHLKTYYPKEIKRRTKRGVDAYYTCDHGHVWTCWWNANRLKPGQ